jgi:TPR repeat protein
MHEQGRGVPKDVAKAAAWYRRAAEQGDPQAQYDLSIMLLTGEGVTRDDAEAAQRLRVAAKAGVVPAQYNLGVVLATGRGVGADHAEAHAWFTLAAASSLARIADASRKAAETLAGRLDIAGLGRSAAVRKAYEAGRAS